MGSLSTGGGSSAVAASTHAGCDRFRLTDPLITGKTRRALASTLGAPDLGLGIPEARWMRAMTFESLIHSERFVAELLTKAVGQLGLPRPAAIRRRSGKVSVAKTLEHLIQAHKQALTADEATMITELALPYLDLENTADATPVKPDFAIVCPRHEDGKAVGSWLIMGDAKDYERVRSRIDDGRLLKGFLQVALGAESAARWSKLPAGMVVHGSGTLAVPRNAFLQPEAQVERLDDHRAEVRNRAAERLAEMAQRGTASILEAELAAHVEHVKATFDPRTCSTCSLYSYCRGELRASTDAGSLLIEIGIDPVHRPALLGLVAGTGEVGVAPASTMAQVIATAAGLPEWSSRRRTDPVGRPGTINLALAKSDAAALGVHGLALQRVTAKGSAPWEQHTFLEPQAPATRTAVMELIGEALDASMKESLLPLHLVVPDRPTGDLLASMADSLAGVELSRLRWQRDLDEGRPALTFDGEPATLHDPLSERARLAVSFLLEEDRARAMTLRSALVDLRAVLSAHFTAGGPASDSGRLDYLVRWATATTALDHRSVSDEIAALEHTPGARLANVMSDRIHGASRRGKADTKKYTTLVKAELTYKSSVFEAAVKVLATRPDSRLRDVYRALELDAQAAWGRRLALQAGDLVRFSRTQRFWRNAQVDVLDADAKCGAQLEVLIDLRAARDHAVDAGKRDLALATITSLTPLRLEVASRRLGDGSTVVALHRNDETLVELTSTTLTIQTTNFKFRGLPIGLLAGQTGRTTLDWTATPPAGLEIGDELVIADATWFGKLFANGVDLAVPRPSVDNLASPKLTCTASSYASAPDQHRWCCRSHASAEAEFADVLAGRRSRGELNPETWPPLIDDERFDVGNQIDVAPPAGPAPADLTLDDLD